MKTFFVVLISNLMATAAFAWPAVGDTALYDVAIQQGAQSETGTIQFTTTAIDATQNQVSIQQIVTTAHGQPNTQTTTAKLTDLQQFAQAVPSVAANCAQYGGTAEAVTTPAGVFNACKMSSDDATQTGFTWYADVVFGWVKQTSTNKTSGQVVSALLKSATAGK